MWDASKFILVVVYVIIMYERHIHHNERNVIHLPYLREK